MINATLLYFYFNTHTLTHPHTHIHTHGMKRVLISMQRGITFVRVVNHNCVRAKMYCNGYPDLGRVRR